MWTQTGPPVPSVTRIPGENVNGIIVPQDLQIVIIILYYKNDFVLVCCM